MGLDGGSLLNRREYLVKTRKEEVTSHLIDVQHRARKNWTTCALTGSPLWEPVCACGKGFLYNKESVLKYLIKLKKRISETIRDQPKRSKHRLMSHIRGLKDLITLQLQVNERKYPLAIQGESAVLDSSAMESFWVCPLSGKEANGIARFVFFMECGHVMSYDCVKSHGSLILGCPLCGKLGPYFHIHPEESLADEQLKRFQDVVRQKRTRQLSWKS